MDLIFKALGDPARRKILDSLRAKDGQTLSDLEPQLDMTRFGVMKHLGVLEDAGLIVTRKRGRFKHHYLNALPLQQAIDRWIEPLLAKPAARHLLDLKTKLEGDTAMSDTPDFVMETYINCAQDALWAALTDPEEMAHYHFLNCTARGALAASGDRMEILRPDGILMLANTLTNADPKTRLDITFEPHWAAPDMPHSRCSYLITPGNGKGGAPCKLRLEHYSIPAGQEGIADGWARTLSGLKSYLETGRDARFGREEA